MTCACGKVINEESNFCPNCGTSLYGNTYEELSEDINNSNDSANTSEENDIISVKSWVITFALFFIPYVGPIVYFVMLFVWGLSKTTHPTKRNFALAQLIMFVFIVIIMIVFYGAYWNDMMNMMQGLMNESGGSGNFY